MSIYLYCLGCDSQQKAKEIRIKQVKKMNKLINSIFHVAQWLKQEKKKLSLHTNARQGNNNLKRFWGPLLTLMILMSELMFESFAAIYCI